MGLLMHMLVLLVAIIVVVALEQLLEYVFLKENIITNIIKKYFLK